VERAASIQVLDLDAEARRAPRPLSFVSPLGPRKPTWRPTPNVVMNPLHSSGLSPRIGCYFPAPRPFAPTSRSDRADASPRRVDPAASHRRCAGQGVECPSELDDRYAPAFADGGNRLGGPINAILGHPGPFESDPAPMKRRSSSPFFDRFLFGCVLTENIVEVRPAAAT